MTILPLEILFIRLFVKILSMKVAEIVYTRVGLSNEGSIEVDFFSFMFALFIISMLFCCYLSWLNSCTVYLSRS